MPKDMARKGEKDGKEMKKKNWHKTSPNQISAPLILDPVAGEMTSEMKNVCKKFEDVTGFRVAVQTRAGRACFYFLYYVF